MPELSIKTGERFDRLTVLKEVDRIDGRRAFKLKCDCGKVVTKTLISFTRTRATRSCGCLFREALSNKKTHGMSQTPTYAVVWQGMRGRCENPNHKSYSDYGGRGVKICKRWLIFENFLADMGERPSPKHEITRMNNDGDYKPSNCCWSTDGRQQNINRRAMGRTSKYRGVDFWNNQKWRARFNVKGKDARHLGLFDTEEEAARAYDEIARLHKGFMLNFPRG